MSLILLGILNSQVTGGGAAAYDLLETQVLSSSASSVTFTGLGSYSDYKHLQIRAVTRNSFSGTGTRNLSIRINSDTGSNYAYHYLRGNGSAVSSSSSTSATELQIVNSSPKDAETTGIFGVNVIDLLDFSNTSKNSTIRALSGAYTSGEKEINLTSGLWANTNAVTSVLLYEASYDFVAGSRFSLYGVK